MKNLIGSSIDHYQILVKIRETPTRILYRAYNTRAQTYTALEVVKRTGPDPGELLRLVNDQVYKNAELAHPNIASITDTGIWDGLIYIVYSFSPSQLFRRFFNRTHSWRELSREFVSITHALVYAHEKGIVHGALHPASIVLDEKRNPILFDFGFEQIITNYLLARSPGTWINRWGFEYRAPEQLSGDPPNERCDIYALGIMLHEWLIGKIALLDSTVPGTLNLRKTATETIDKTSTIPPVIKNLIEKCIAPNPADRYQSMQEMYIVLARGALDMSITKRMVRKPLEIQPQRWKGRQFPLRLGAVALLAALVLVFMTIPGLSAPSPSATPTPSRTQITPTPAIVEPTFTPTREAVLTETPTPVSIVFPVFQGTPVSAVVNRTLSIENINQMIMLSLWGMGDVNRLVSSPDGKQVAAASSVGIFIFDAQSMKLEKYIDTSSWITALDYSPDGGTLAAGDRDGLIQLWNTATWQESEAPYSGHTKAILDLAFSPDGTKLASVSLDRLLIQWSVNSPDLQKLVSPEVINGLTAVAYSGDSARLITGGNDFQISIWDAATLTVLQKKPFSSRIEDIAGIHASNLFIVGGSNQQVALFDINGETSLTNVGSLRYPLTAIAVSPDGTLIAAGDINGGITVWDASGEAFAEQWEISNYISGTSFDLDLPGTPHSLAFSPDGTLIFSGLHNGIIRSVEARSGAEIGQNQSLDAHVNRFEVSPDSQYLIMQQETNLLTIWSLESGMPLYQRQGEIRGDNPFSQNNDMFAVAADRETVKVYNPANGDEIYSFTSARNPKTIQFIKESSQLVTVYDQSMELWSMASGEGLKTTPRYEGTGCATYYDVNDEPVVYVTNYDHVVAQDQNRDGLCSFDPLDWAVAINEDQGWVAYGGSSKLALHSLLNAGSEDQDMRGVNRKNIVRVALSPDGALLAAAYDDNTIHIWDAATQEELSNFYGHNHAVTDLQFTPDGKLLISSSLDGTIRLWGVPY